MSKYIHIIKRSGYLLLVCFILILGVFVFQHSPIFEGDNNTEKEEFIEEEENGKQEFESEGEEKGEISYEQDRYKSESIFFLGIHEGKIAIYEKTTESKTILREVLPYPVKDVYKEKLQEGIIFETEEEKKLILENLTS